MPKFGKVFIDDGDVHDVKDVIKSKLGGVPGISAILGRKGASNFDFWVGNDGMLWIGENQSGGKEKKTSLDFFDVFPEYAPKTDQNLESNRPADWNPYEGLSDSDQDV